MRSLIVLGLIFQTDAWCAPPPAAATEPEPEAVRLEPIDRAELPPRLTLVESIAAEQLISPLVCERIRTIRSWIPRRVCFPRTQLDAWRRNRGERVAHDIRTLGEILRYQNRARY